MPSTSTGNWGVIRQLTPREYGRLAVDDPDPARKPLHAGAVALAFDAARLCLWPATPGGGGPEEARGNQGG